MVARVVHLVWIATAVWACADSVHAGVVDERNADRRGFAGDRAPALVDARPISFGAADTSLLAGGVDLPGSVKPLPFGPATGAETPIQPDSAEREQISLPPPPGSFHLVLGGLGTLGAWSLSRFLRKPHLSHVPEWYQELGPRQVGHATALEIDGSGLLAWTFDQPLMDLPAGRFSVAADNIIRILPQDSSRPSAPRGPPFTG